jgi:hypothetical protein
VGAQSGARLFFSRPLLARLYKSRLGDFHQGLSTEMLNIKYENQASHEFSTLAGYRE